MNWDELHKGDKLYLLVPIQNIETNEIVYEYQESYVINIKITENRTGRFVSLRFKYTNSHNKRIRKEFIIPDWQNSTPCIICEKHAMWINNKNWYGHMIMCNENPEQLNNAYHKLIEYKTKEIQILIESQKKLLKKLKINQKKNIYEQKEIN